MQWLADALLSVVNAIIGLVFPVLSWVLQICELPLNMCTGLWEQVILFIKWAQIELFNFLFIIFDALVLQKIGGNEHVFDFLNGAIDVLVWTNYFFPVGAFVRWLSFLAVLVPIFFIALLTIKLVKIVMSAL